ncbi:carboxymuconolactone decarboxylase family protein [Microbispora amethystogenes]|uniref:Carboxymuconolactone decarboxylase n=1 Tax=Microbispora amethystogenes TaxID=1427754 RepID=A0ABQ4FAP4_9ACTN|nr:carboxymuconolactone decarboxylase family protein [Microbispora amethystogenes]GIH31830.1 carboxymuconolactone decarboxylase [Microbispora amethystogenes]
MPHITLGSDAPGIRGLFEFRPETARPLNALVETLLRGDSTLSRGERELIAAYVSALNECRFCYSSHAAFAAAQLPQGMTLVEQVRRDPATAPIPAKLRALLGIAAAVQRGGREVGEQEVAAALAEGATDLEIHDTVLIAAAFCMFNRYVDGLATVAPDDPDGYAAVAQWIVSEGYVAEPPKVEAAARP